MKKFAVPQLICGANKYLTAFVLIFSAAGLMAQSRNPHAIPGQYIVIINRGSTPADVANTHGLARRNTYSQALNGFAAQIPEGRLEALENDPRVELIEQDQIVSAFAQTLPTGVSRIGATRSTLALIDGLDQRVDADIAILDTGIDLTHPDLNVFRAVSFTADSTTGNDGNGHGSHVAGTAAALDNGFGVVGVAPGARLWAVKVLDNTGYGSWSTIIQGLDYVCLHADEIEVANMSWGDVGRSDALRRAIQNCVAKGVICVAAAGNNAQDIFGADGIFETDDDVIPAAYPEVMTISAMQDNDGRPGSLGPYTGYGPDDSLASNFSNFSRGAAPGNPVLSPGGAIDLAAPGWNIYSTYRNGSYTMLWGTSMAAPHAAGAAALYCAQKGRAYNAQGVAAIRQAMIFAAEPQTVWGPLDTLDPDGHHEPLVTATFDNATGNLPPVISILSPSSGSTSFSDNAALLTDSALDREEGNISSRTTWYSSINGSLGTGPNVFAQLAPGIHIITASVTDAAGNTSRDSITLSVVSPVPRLSSSVATDKTTYITKNIVKVRVTITDGIQKIAGASVNMLITTALGKSVSASGITDGTGVATFSYTVNAKRDGVGTYTVAIAAAKSGYEPTRSSTTFTVSK